MAVARARGVILRLARRRPLAIAVGAAMVVPAVWIEFGGGAAAWWLDGLALLLGATGAALFWTGLTGTRGDWVDSSEK